jgi:glutamate synthase domain-containing protein 3
VLENWTGMLPKFVKVYPHEFKRVMAKRAAQQAASDDGAAIGGRI